MNSPAEWAKVFLLSASVGLIILAACRSGPEVPAEFSLEYACLNRNLPPCLAAVEFAARVADRTDGRVQIEIITISDLGFPIVQVLSRLGDGTLEMAEIHSVHFRSEEDRAMLDMLDLWGLYRDYETQAQVTDAIKEDIEGIIAERSGGVVLASQFYPSNYFFAKKPLRTEADVQGLRIRSPNAVSRDLLTGMGAIAKDVRLGTVYSGLQRGELEAAISCSSCGAGLSWYDEAGYLVGPIPAIGHSWIIINSKIWLEIPADVQFIIREEAKRLEAATKEDARVIWDRRGVEKNVSAGMEHFELTPELKDLMRAAALTNVLPNWVDRAGGPGSDPVTVFNEKAAPIIKVRIAQDGTVNEID